ncbi:putative apolipoprotein(a)-like protein 2 [Saccoglossus kowalevskii]
MVKDEKSTNVLVISICVANIGLAIALLVLVFVLAFRGDGHPFDTAECYEKADGSDYRGFINITKSGLTCAAWTVQTPHYHSRTPKNFPNAGLGEHNYCRNPDRDVAVWCYTTKRDMRLEYCDVGLPRKTCSKSTTPVISLVEMHTGTEATTQGTSLNKTASPMSEIKKE